MTNSTRPEDAKVLDRVRADINSGQSFRYVEASLDSGDRLNYSPPLSARDLSKVLAVLAGFASEGDRAADAAMAALRSINRYGSAYQIGSQIARSLRESATSTWEDTTSATGPEAGRPSDHRHASTFRFALLCRLAVDEVLAALGARIGQSGGPGWANVDLAIAENLHPFSLPVVRASIDRTLTARAAKAGE